MIDAFEYIGGVDEAGRGPLAGPVVAAAVVLRDNQAIAGVRDSKKLSAAQRERLALVIRKEACCWAIGMASVAEIDALNILHATMLAMRRAVEALGRVPQRLHVDGNRCPALPAAYDGITIPLVGGDDRCPAVGAASIIAKVERDRLMDALHDRYPQYGFDRHRGYPTAEHREVLARLGATPEHRRSFRPVRVVVEGA